MSEALVRLLRERIPDLDGRIVDAFAVVDRALFVPDGVDPYTDGIGVLAQDDDGPTSTISSPVIVAQMLQQARIEPGMSVLEIGTASGFNAALMAQLGAQVTSIEVQPQLIETARANLRRAGVHADVFHGDGNLGWPEAAPYDRVVFTCSAWQAPRWVWEQTTATARAIMPTRWGVGASWALDRSAEDWNCGDAFDCGFIPLVGEEQPPRVSNVIPGLSFVGQRRAERVADEPVATWTGIEIGRWSVQTLMHRVLSDPRGGQVHGHRSTGDPLISHRGVAALWDAGTLAYPVARPMAERRLELGVACAGPHRELAADLRAILTDWAASPDVFLPLRLPATPKHRA